LVLSEFFASKGYNIYLHYYKTDNIEIVQRKLESYNIKCTFIYADLTNEVERNNFIDQSTDFIMQSEILINNASIFNNIPFSHCDFFDLHANYNIHLFVPFLLSKIFTKNNINNKMMINVIDSQLQNRQSYNHFSYFLSKNSLQYFTNSLVIEFPKIFFASLLPKIIIKYDSSVREYIYKTLNDIIKIRNDKLTNNIVKII
ncbi:MAG: SDR family NAD(P)-dependent oxidoreductase, partial [Anaplasmataceae bacterium]|nr:SDR family NAD(P)-dependent oxidoreductase [Anaplasmataceae bacterium]